MTGTVTTPDLSRVPRVLRLRLSDEATWASEPWEADGPATVAAGVRRAWALRVETELPGDGHPLLALRRRLREIDDWIAERRARPVAIDDARASWERQAEHWRHQARTLYGARATLHLQVEGPRAGDWLGPWRHGAGPSGPLVSAEVTTEDVERARIWEHCRLAWAHVQMISDFCGEVGTWATEALRPDLSIVSPPEEDE